MPETGNNPSSVAILSVDTAKTVLVPAELFERGSEEDYLRFNGMALSDGEVAVASEPENDIVAVMGVSADVWSTVEAGYKRGEVVLTSPLLAIIAKCGERSKREVRIVLTAGGNVYIAVWEKGLRMAEVLPDASIDSLLYYMQVIGRQFALRKFEIFVSGDPNHARAKEAAEALKEYYPKVKMCE